MDLDLTNQPLQDVAIPYFDSKTYQKADESSIIKRKSARISTRKALNDKSLNKLDENISSTHISYIKHPKYINITEHNNLLPLMQKKIKKTKKVHNKPSSFQDENANKSTKSSRKRWTAEEDKKILDLVAEHGQAWTIIASFFKGMIGKQIRDRYLNYLRPGIARVKWTQADDRLLLQYVEEIGHRWKIIAQKMEGRTEAQVKNRYYGNLKRKFGISSDTEENFSDEEGKQEFSKNIINQNSSETAVTENDVLSKELDVDKFFDFGDSEKTQVEYFS